MVRFVPPAMPSVLLLKVIVGHHLGQEAGARRCRSRRPAASKRGIMISLSLHQVAQPQSLRPQSRRRQPSWVLTQAAALPRVVNGSCRGGQALARHTLPPSAAATPDACMVTLMTDRCCWVMTTATRACPWWGPMCCCCCCCCGLRRRHQAAGRSVPPAAHLHLLPLQGSHHSRHMRLDLLLLCHEGSIRDALSLLCGCDAPLHIVDAGCQRLNVRGAGLGLLQLQPATPRPHTRATSMAAMAACEWCSGASTA